ncbi:Homeodomain-like protein [Cordyceps militaris]|uniref:Homeodomain-like protein n=1 Tax=Cordyceps militaris TaxID=73501 RepID=A0A2H4SMV5_CORMI|nr:Homeodomain-like protein [Cordyceps militaris]
MGAYESDFEPSGSDSCQHLSGSDDNSDADSARSVILGEDAEEAHSVSDGSANQQSPRKRSGEDDHALRPFKRQRSRLNPDYLDMLNKDIEEAALRVCLDDDDDDTVLPDSQLGLTYWSSPEKHRFFEALARLGRHDLPGIAQRVGTKSTIEVKHYLLVLHEAVAARSASFSRYLAPTEYPAAVELTPPCCHAQEEAADAVSLMQEARENQREEDRWQKYWDITPKLAAELRTKKPKDDAASKLAFTRLFHVSRWLNLSNHVFMNSTIPGNNWRNVDSRPPSMWATTLEDFHSLALSLTRRLLQATLFITMSRIRAKSELGDGIRNTVRKRDVEAAVASLGLPHNMSDMWLKSARRLRLDVYENPPTRNKYEEEEEEEGPMTYDEVEAVLGPKEPSPAPGVGSDLAGFNMDPLNSSDEEDDSAADDSAADDSDAEGQRDHQPLDAEACAVNREVNEMLWFAAAGLRDLPNTRRALRLRVEAERRQEREADAFDEHASNAAETAMWALLHRAAPAPRPKPARAATVRHSTVDLENLYPMNRTWADDLEYRAEWETLQKPVNTVTHDNEDEYD